MVERRVERICDAPGRLDVFAAEIAGRHALARRHVDSRWVRDG